MSDPSSKASSRNANNMAVSHAAAESFLNVRVAKYFGRDLFEGTVESIRNDSDGETLYRIAYDDGDGEELNLQELRQVMYMAETMPMAASSAENSNDNDNKNNKKRKETSKEDEDKEKDDDDEVQVVQVVSPRRSGRARQSTTIEIDGHTVLRQNNYTVTGINYIYHAEDPQQTSAPRPVKKAKTSNRPAGVVVKSAAQLSRQAHNEAVQAATQPKLALRRQFLAHHVGRLEPFCEPHILEDLKQQQSSTPLLTKPAPVTTPRQIQATLRDYQLRGLQFMVNMHKQNLSMILGDEMGLGKTLQTISLLCYLKEEEHVTGPSLVLCPLSVLSSWCLELQKWAPQLNVFRLHASDQVEQARQKHELNEHATDYDVIVTTYEMAKVPALTSFYQRLHFHYLVLDEGHKIKGHLTQLAAAVRKIHAGNTLLLTGTPLQNNLVELWSLLNFMYPAVFTTLEPFQQHFNLTGGPSAGSNKQVVVDKGFLMQTQKLLELFMLRRLKSEVEKLMPAKLETKVLCPLSKTQVFWYKALLMKDVGQLAKMDEAVSTSLGANRHTMLRSLFMQLRKCCNHPFLFTGAETDPDQTPLAELVASSGKLSVLDMLLQSLFRKGHRSVLFSQFTTLLDVLEDYCILRGWKYCRLDGSTDRARRNYLIRRFNEPNSPYFLFLMSTRSGGQGLNLQSADTCILFDSDWNPQSDIQAMGRVHRIGQTKTVHVYRLVSNGTVEERMMERAEKKLLLEMVNRESKDATFDQEDMARGLSAKELLEDIKFGCEAIFGNSGQAELPSWKDIENITDRSRTESDSVGKLKGGTSRNAGTFDAEKDFSASHLFGGADFRAIREEREKQMEEEVPKSLKGIAHLWKEIQTLDKTRARKSRIVLVDGTGSGYGKTSVPVLATNNYELANGESSVFDRELSKTNKGNFGVLKKKKAAKFENQDHCQVCGDGGLLLCCPQCPCSVHLKCSEVRRTSEFEKCTHHRCSKCSKNRQSAGGLLYPCESCSLAFCEDCLPEEGVTFLDSVDRFDKLGFDSYHNKVVYIHCSPICNNYAKKEYGYKSPKDRRVQKEPLNLSYNFGASDDVNVGKQKSQRLSRKVSLEPQMSADSKPPPNNKSGGFSSKVITRGSTRGSTRGTTSSPISISDSSSSDGAPAPPVSDRDSLVI